MNTVMNGSLIRVGPAWNILRQPPGSSDSSMTVNVLNWMTPMICPPIPGWSSHRATVRHWAGLRPMRLPINMSKWSVGTATSLGCTVARPNNVWPLICCWTATSVSSRWVAAPEPVSQLWPCVLDSKLCWNAASIRKSLFFAPSTLSGAKSLATCPVAKKRK